MFTTPNLFNIRSTFRTRLGRFVNGLLASELLLPPQAPVHAVIMFLARIPFMPGTLVDNTSFESTGRAAEYWPIGTR